MQITSFSRTVYLFFLVLTIPLALSSCSNTVSSADPQEEKTSTPKTSDMESESLQAFLSRDRALPVNFDPSNYILVAYEQDEYSAMESDDPERIHKICMDLSKVIVTGPYESDVYQTDSGRRIYLTDKEGKTIYISFDGPYLTYGGRYEIEEDDDLWWDIRSWQIDEGW